MILQHSFLKSFRRMAFRNTAGNLSYVLINNRVRLFTTETAVQKITFRSFRRRRSSNAITWFLLVFPASSFALGTWQVFRKFEKDELIKEFAKILDQPAIDLPKDLDELELMEYQKVRVRGKFDHSREICLGPRPYVDEFSEKIISTLISRTKPGFLIITPFKLSDRDLTILVNRGWVPPNKKLPSARPEGQITDEVEIVGLIRHQDSRKPYGVENGPKRNVWVYRDLTEMSKETGASPIFIDADKSSTVPGGPIGGQTVVRFPNDHLSYIFTWYGLSMVSGYMWYLRFCQRIRIMI